MTHLVHRVQIWKTCSILTTTPSPGLGQSRAALIRVCIHDGSSAGELAPANGGTSESCGVVSKQQDGESSQGFLVGDVFIPWSQPSLKVAMALPPNGDILVVRCPVCGSGRIDDAPTSPNISLKAAEAFGVDQANLVPLHATCHVSGDRVDPMLLELCTKPMGTR
jgi:hypothetical protein